MPKSARKRKHSTTSEVPMESEDLDSRPTKEKIRPNRPDSDDRTKFQNLLFDYASRNTLTTSEAFLEHFDDIPEGPTPDSGVESIGSAESDSMSPRRPAWSDEDDLGIDVGEALNSQRRKLPLGGINERSNNYSVLLKNKFQSIVGTPNWAKIKRKIEDSNDEILTTVGFTSKAPRMSLPAGSLEFKKVKDLNSQSYNEGPFINAIEFHPTSSVGLVAGNKGVATLFACDGNKNSKLHSIAFEHFPILCAKFIKNGDEAILGSRQGHIFIYDLMAAKALRYNLPPGVTQCKNFVPSPNSQFFAVAGKWGEVHLMSGISKEKIATLKQDGEVTALKYNANGDLLFGHSDNGEVTIWDINMRRVRHKFMDEGCLHGSALAISSSDQFLACGSAQGVVNLYGMEDALKNKLPKPRKTIMNLTTSIKGLEFNCTSELLGLAAADIKNSVKLFHIASGTVFSNFPPFQSKLGLVNCINFTPGSGFFALGNQKSVVSLFRFKHYKNY
ncbi:hypothetical protein ABEB36_001914 [Hypothenemus hampei]|uniref:U3 small nucleolar RNA-associated protein 18 homolog n=1 Tax=Hypothenemus hampei TaxID=57062 RepID=A0ABD1FJP0_HYPHA